jgi:ribonuclease J
VLRIVPLGGLGEIGLNAMVIESNGRRMLVDCGLMFPRTSLPGVDVISPDFTWLKDAPESLDGIVLTHAHEDHIGALPFLLREVNVPVWGTPFTLALARHRLEEANVKTELRVLSCRDPFKVGDAFTVEAVRVTHSVPDSVALIIKTANGTVVHSGDFKLDGAPIDGQLTDLERIAETAEEGIALLLADSTNAEVETETPSESLVAQTMEKVLSTAKGRVIVTLFGSHLFRVRHLLQLAAKLGRKPAVLGRSLERNTSLAAELGYLGPNPGLVPFEETGKLPPHQVLLLVTGAQAEPRAALSSMLQPRPIDDKIAPIGPTDTVVMSARTIPGNEALVSGLIDRLLAKGSTVLHPGNTPGIHVSGHAARPELQRFLTTARPQVFVPVHGELRHLRAHHALAKATLGEQTQSLLLTDGDQLGVDAGRAVPLGRVPIGQHFRRRDSEGIVTPEVIDERRWLAEGGVVVVTLALAHDPMRIAWGPHVEGLGLSTEEQAFLPLAATGAREALEEVSKVLWADDARVREELARGVRRVFRQLSGRKPPVVPVLVKL